MRKIATVSALIVLATAMPFAQDAMKAVPEHCEIAFENEYVRVLRWTVPPGGKVAMHEHPALVTVSLTSDKTRFTLPDGETRDAESKAGQATWSEPEKHASENRGTSQGHVIQVELKKAPGAAGAVGTAGSPDPTSVDPEHYTVEFENDRVRVLRIRYGANEKSVMHYHPRSVAVFLTDGQGQFTLPDGKTIDNRFKGGDVRWGDAEQHLPANMGTTPFELVLIELR